ncbi:MAG TPA: hypothetical protein PLU10_12685 [Chitinophagaceae bacterium]|nr:hypothetical protein [Chitinophagaceae bacterium]
MKNLKFIGVAILFISMMVFSEIATAHPHHRHARHAIRRHHWSMCHRPPTHANFSRRYHGRHHHNNYHGRNQSQQRRRHH